MLFFDDACFSFLHRFVRVRSWVGRLFDEQFCIGARNHVVLTMPLGKLDSLGMGIFS